LSGRFIYDLSDYLVEIIKQKFISLTDIEKLLKEIKTPTKFLTDDLEIYRTHPKEYKFNKFTFLKSTISYPLLIYEISGLLIKIEIIVKEKQKAIGIQPMLFLCIPMKLMEDFKELENEVVKAKQKTNYLVDKNNFQFIIETIKIFAILSEKHHQDIVNILQTILTYENI
jgi:R.Pab1 restriction endonuclease